MKDVSNPGAMLFSALGGQREAAATEAPAVEATVDPVETPEPAAPADPPKYTNPMDDPFVKGLVERETNQRLSVERERARQAEFEAQLSQLDNESYGAYMRAQRAQQQNINQVQEQLAVKFYQEGYNDVIAKIPELQRLTPEEAQRLNPSNFQTYGAMMNEYAVFVADKRAEAKAEKLAEEKLAKKLAAAKAEELTKLRKSYPKQPANSGNPAATRLPVEGTKGTDLLRNALLNQQKQ